MTSGLYAIRLNYVDVTLTLLYENLLPKHDASSTRRAPLSAGTATSRDAPSLQLSRTTTSPGVRTTNALSTVMC